MLSGRSLLIRRTRSATLFPYTTLFRSLEAPGHLADLLDAALKVPLVAHQLQVVDDDQAEPTFHRVVQPARLGARPEEHTSELQSRRELVCRLLLENKKHDPELLDLERT